MFAKSNSGKSKRKSRAKPYLAWEQIELQSGGLYATYLREIANRFPNLTPMELRVASLVRGMLPNYEIAKKLSISEETVENHRIRIRRKLGLVKENLVSFLIGN